MLMERCCPDRCSHQFYIYIYIYTHALYIIYIYVYKHIIHYIYIYTLYIYIYIYIHIIHYIYIHIIHYIYIYIYVYMNISYLYTKKTAGPSAAFLLPGCEMAVLAHCLERLSSVAWCMEEMYLEIWVCLKIVYP